MIEIWKDIEGYEGIYQVSEDARVRSRNFGKIIILSPAINKGGYSHITLKRKGISKSFCIHRLVAIHFISNPENLSCVCHKKESYPLDNSVKNLFWGSYAQNTRDMINKGRANNSFINNHPNKGKFGKDSKSSKNVLQFTINNEFIREWYSMADIKRELGIFKTAISGCCNEKYGFKTAGGFIWKFK